MTMSPPPSQTTASARLSARSRKKSKTGCKTCKTRKVKCDEKHPVCDNCKMYYNNRVQVCEYDYSCTPGHRNSKRSSLVVSSASKNSALCHVTAPPLPQLKQELPKAVGLLTLDPFGTSPQKTSLPYSQQLSSNYLYSVIEMCTPFGECRGASPFWHAWWQLVHSDRVLYHVMLSKSALQLEHAQSKRNAYNSEEYTRESIRTLRARIEDPIAGSSDQSISAVAVLAGLESARKNFRMMKIHIDGLKRMVALRGGLSKVKASNPVAATVAHWFPMVLLQESIFPPDEDETTNQPRRLISDVDSVQPPTQLDPRTFALHPSIINLMEESRIATQTWTGDLQSYINSLWQRLLHVDLSAKDHCSSLSDACRYGICIFFLFLFSGRYPDTTLLVNAWLHKLKSALVGVLPASGVDSKLIVWMLALGGVAALNNPERDWFVGYLLTTITDLQLESWEDMQHAMAQILWMQKIDETQFRKLWEEVQSLKECLHE